MENTAIADFEKVAETIIHQINRTDFWARARWGVKQILSTSDGVQFNCTKRIKILVKLDAATDTYSIEIGRMSGRFDYTIKAETSMVFADQLVMVIDA